jgi:hypothetical protein
MSIADAGLVPLDHLEWLLKKHATKFTKASTGALASKVTGGPAEREEVLLALDKAVPGTRDRLLEMWRSHGSMAVHLWRLPWAVSLDASTVRKEVGKILKMSLGKAEHELPGTLTAAGDTRIVRIQIADDALRATVSRAFNASRTFEGQTRADLASVETDLMLSFDGSGILEVYATHTNATTAVVTLIERAWGTNIPRKVKEREKLLTPIVFKESTVASLKRKLKMEQTSMTGPDAQNEFGEVTYNGKMKGLLPAPLANVARSTKQDASVNYIRDFRMSFEHDDGFVQDLVVQFYLKSKHPHLKFKNKASRAAARKVIDELCALVGTRP